MSFRSLKSIRATRPSFVATAKHDVDSAETMQVDGDKEPTIAPTTLSKAPPAREPDILETSLPPNLEIQVTKTKGRGLYVKHPGYKPGDTILALKPHISTLATPHLPDYCSSCFSPGSQGLKRCVKCKIVMYCDSECQSRDWTWHKNECEALQRWITPSNLASPEPSKPSFSPISFSDRQTYELHHGSQYEGIQPEEQSIPQPTPPNDAIRSLARILWRKQKLGVESTWVKEIDSLQSHRAALLHPLSAAPSDHDVSPDSETDSVLYSRLSHGLIHYLGLSSPQELKERFSIGSVGELVDLVSRFITNTFTLTTPTLSPIGACVSPVVALVNHSCEPNAVVVFPRSSGSKTPEPLLQVVAIACIKPGEEILTSYIDTTLPRQTRRRQLRETYHFICRCSLCEPLTASSPSSNSVSTPKLTSPVNLPTIDMRDAMWCPKRCVSRDGSTRGVCLIPGEGDTTTRCLQCNAVVKDPEAVLDIVRIGQEGLEKTERVQDEDPQKALQLTTNLVPLLASAGLVPGAHPLLALTRLHTGLLVERLGHVLTDLHGEPSEISKRKGVGKAKEGIEEVFSPQMQSSPSSQRGEETKESLITLPEAQEMLDETIRYSTRANEGLAQIFRVGHPVRGVALAELGKLLAVDEPNPRDLEGAGSSTGHDCNIRTAGGQTGMQKLSYPPSGPARLQLAHTTLVRALDELKIGFGSGYSVGAAGSPPDSCSASISPTGTSGPTSMGGSSRVAESASVKTYGGEGGGEVGREIRRMIVDVEKELNVWENGVRRVVDDARAAKAGGRGSQR